MKENLANLLTINVIIERYQEFVDRIEASSTFEEVLYWHKEAWKVGFQNENIGPCAYGIFRTKSIEKMILDEIYLGGIYGLSTLPATDWRKAGIDEYTVAFKQYKRLLLSNFYVIWQNARRKYDEYREKGYPVRIQQR